MGLLEGLLGDKLGWGAAREAAVRELRLWADIEATGREVML